MHSQDCLYSYMIQWRRETLGKVEIMTLVAHWQCSSHHIDSVLISSRRYSSPQSNGVKPFHSIVLYCQHYHGETVQPCKKNKFIEWDISNAMLTRHDNSSRNISPSSTGCTKTGDSPLKSKHCNALCKKERKRSSSSFSFQGVKLGQQLSILSLPIGNGCIH